MAQMGMYILMHNKIISTMLDWQRPCSFQIPRHKIYLTSLNQLIDRKIVLQPEIQTNNKIFPRCNLPKKLTFSLQRTKSCAQIRQKKFDLNSNSKNLRKIGVETSRLGRSDQKKRQSQYQNEKLRVTYVSEHKQRINSFSNPVLKISLASAVPVSVPVSVPVAEPFNFSAQRCNEGYHSVQLQSERPQRQFLRKGSNLQKQVVVSLLRNKLSKQKGVDQKKQYSNQQIVKMIQVFKGVVSHQSTKKTKKLLQVDRNITPLSKRLQLKELKGWEQDEPLGEDDQNERK